MAISTIHGLSGVKIDATVIGAIERQTVGLGADMRGDALSGEAWARFVSLYKVAPAVSFVTRQVAAALGACAPPGSSISGLTAKLTLYASKKVQGGLPASGTNHRSYTLNHGMLYPESVSCQDTDDARVTYNAAITYDGSNDPVVEADSVALPTLPTEERYGLGPATIGGISIGNIKSIDCQCGITVGLDSAGGDVYNTIAYVQLWEPMWTIRTTDVLTMAAAKIPRSGIACTQANTSFYLRKRAAGNTYVSDVTAAHIKAVMAGMAVVDTPFDGDSDKGEATITVKGSYDGTNNPLVFTTGVAIA